MADHHETAKQALKKHFRDYLKPSSYRLTYRLKNVNELLSLDHDLFILDRDCTLTGYHARERAKEFEDTLQAIGPRAELVSNSSYNEFRRIGDIFGNIVPVSKLVRLNDQAGQSLLRIENGKISLWHFYSGGAGFVEWDSSHFSSDGELKEEITHNYKKPDPRIIQRVIDFNVQQQRIPENPRVLMVGDRHLTDIVAGNLAGVETARVKPYKPFTDKPILIATRYFLDSPVGAIISRIASKK